VGGKEGGVTASKCFSLEYIYFFLLQSCCNANKKTLLSHIVFLSLSHLLFPRFYGPLSLQSQCPRAVLEIVLISRHPHMSGVPNLFGNSELLY